MLWIDADVADVSMVARDWAEHRAALDTHAEVLREQRAALLESWEGAAAEEAAHRLGVLADRMEKISELAGAGQRAAQDAADALAMARAMMPPPPGGAAAPLGGPAPTAPGLAAGPELPNFGGATQLPAPTTPGLAPGPELPTFGGGAPTIPGLAAGPEIRGASDASFGGGSSQLPASTFPGFAPAPEIPGAAAFGGGFGQPPASNLPATPEIPGAAPNPALGGGSSFYFGDVMADQQKAQAVRAMQTYESSLVGGSQLIGEARGAIPAAAQTVAAGVAQGMATVSAAVPWERLVGGGSATHMGVGGGPGMTGFGGSVGASPGGVPPGPGGRAGALPGTAAPPLMPAAKFAADSVAARAAGQGGMVPPVGGHRPGGADSEEHENRMPIMDHGLFASDTRPSTAVIDGSTGGQQQ